MDNNYDVIIVGGGVAGLYAAINLPESLKVLVLSKRELTLCNSSLAQGGIAGVYDSPNDNIQLHQNDTLIAGGFKNNNETVHILVSEAAYDIENIINLGVEFDKNSDGTLHRTLEGGHCRRRIFHHKDATGFEVVTKLIAHVKSRENITVLENALMCGINKTDTGFSVNVLLEESYKVFNSHFLILATGGIGRVYEYTTNSAIATGDGIAMAHMLGANIKNLSFIQFHPTAFNNRHTRECFLISEAVRGEGAYLLNCHGERFMHNYDDRLELAPRDVVSHAIILESRKQNSTEFFLDITHKDPEFLVNRFPMIYQNLLSQGYDLTKDRIPIFPCQHYLMGGIDVNENSMTRIQGLYAVGECSHTGVHGNNRLASNSLLEALVFSRRAALDISERHKSCSDKFEESAFESINNKKTIPSGIRTEIRKILQQCYFVIPDKEAVIKGFERIKELNLMLSTGEFLPDSNFVEARSLATVAYLILKEVI